ncbi:pentapeptide repeat-containing protein [Pontibacter anaerobius]|uniref:Pentapeptide repeat-containing protein n=1 Tax=Pontibacter anaerobius TaxID=2993940 RepID=A0ABT3RBI8_9BACT|nr:pentapeptide repeat-containing protein [Pontibacter anaerobius]MCX2738885.1 pentapeptide repeat-containing protein [Pontibacter anaerobius]
MEGQTHEGKTFEKVVYANKPIKNREFEQCTFRNCDFSNADFSQNRFTDCIFIGCNLAMLKLHCSTLSDVVFRECKLTGVNFSECEDILFTVRFENCILDYASFVGRKMAKTPFLHTSLKGADFSNANLANAVFGETDLERAVFSFTNLTGADFSTAFNFEIDPELNTVKKAKFSRHGLQGLLAKYNLQVV